MNSIFCKLKKLKNMNSIFLNTIVRREKEIESERLRILPMGSRVRVVERTPHYFSSGYVGTRVRIDKPIRGWCSIESSNGDMILRPLNPEQTAKCNRDWVDSSPKSSNRKEPIFPEHGTHRFPKGYAYNNVLHNVVTHIICNP